ncbi:30S ribosomal protein S8 [bacterium]|jgi:small subunit ribosomal protein S8|nr:30S ribosomal protein S8 [bacterium]MDP6756473.1 30S ribosomal protein S8 [Patescibacteria group bacterium]|tara:strand:- start:3237 stop:3632 length:396 start_codon:yes stop_codon:yes gene_type:complete
MMTDPISDMLTRIRNGLRAKHETVVVPYSKLKLKLANLLSQEKYIGMVKEIDDNHKKAIEIELKYNGEGSASIEHVARVSKPGLRVYAKKDEMPQVLNGYGIAVISTPAGLMTNKQAKKQGLGGEVICEIY